MVVHIAWVVLREEVNIRVLKIVFTKRRDVILEAVLSLMNGPSLKVKLLTIEALADEVDQFLDVRRVGSWRLG